MPVNIKFPVGHGVEFVLQNDMPMEFPDETVAKAYLRATYSWMTDEEFNNYNFEFPEVIPVTEIRLPEEIRNKCPEDYFEEVCRFAFSIHYEKQLQRQLDYLAKWGNKNIYVELYSDFAPYSFYWITRDKETDQAYSNGGLIFHGAHDGGGHGGTPTFSVSLLPTNGWSIHT
jgi:hypothetical protein